VTTRAPLLKTGLALLVGGCGSEPNPSADTVILVHGLGRTAASMTVLGARLNDAGLRVVMLSSPS
jgi:hypothetical protein